MVRPPAVVEHSPTGIGLLDRVFGSYGRNLSKTYRILERILPLKLVAQLYMVRLLGRPANALPHTELRHRKSGGITNYMLAVTISLNYIVALGSNENEDVRILFGMLWPQV